MKESTALLILQTLNSFQEKKLILLKENKNKPQNPPPQKNTSPVSLSLK